MVVLPLGETSIIVPSSQPIGCMALILFFLNQVWRVKYELILLLNTQTYAVIGVTPFGRLALVGRQSTSKPVASLFGLFFPACVQASLT